MPLQPRKDLALKTRQQYLTYDPETLLRHLVEQITPEHARIQSKSLRRVTDGVEEVLLELDIDGTRYILLRSRPPAPLDAVSLSPREQKITQLVAKGLPNKTIAEILEISPWTVATHLRRIFVKLGVTSRAAMVARVLEGERSGSA